MPEIEHLRKQYLEVLIRWDALPKKQGGSQNLPNCSMIIYELVEIAPWPHNRREAVKGNIYRLATSTVQAFRDGMWRSVCGASKELKYMY